jgi:GrpB-like predicted nucleotidyltransferase (UPF0157 family)
MEDAEIQASPLEKAETPEEYIKSVTIGDRVPHNDKIYLAPYDSEWPAQFYRLANRIRGAIKHKALLLEHVGSTSIPGLSAKPIIDMVLAVADPTDESAYIPPLEGSGFVLRIREPDWFEHRLLKSRDIPGNLHVFTNGCEEIERMLVFRDWLRTHEGDRRLYEQRKRELAGRIWKYRQHYADAKTVVVEEILARAMGSTG